LRRWSSIFDRTLATELIVGAAALALDAARVWQSLDEIAFDVISVASAPRVAHAPVVIVGIDEQSFAEVGARWPWSRAVHARLTRALTQAGASVIAFDVLFSEPADPAGDAAFARAIRASGRVLLAGDMVYRETEHYRGLQRVEPLARLREAGAATGISSIEVSRDQVVRAVPQDPDALWRVALERHGRVLDVPPGALIRYVEPSDLRQVSYYQALDPEQFLSPGVFKDKIVLVGLVLKTSPDPGQRYADTYATPFLRFTGLYSPGVEIHAHLVASAFAGHALVPLPRALVWALGALALALGAWTMRQWSALRCSLIAAGWVAALALAAWLAVERFDRWLAIALPAGVMIGLYLGRGATAYLDELRRKLEIRRAFSLYVAPEVVAEMATHPERLSLGGSRRELTLLFTDLAGFTSMSEGMAPEDVAAVINQYLTRMSAVVLAHGGTIDKFIGDAVMAFWGAPLEDRSHALHATQAAIAMQAEMARWRAELEAHGRPGVHMRVGVHTGVVVVGNMGSKDRLAYTAIGDAVNLAARLEPLNRFYGTEILLSGETATQVGGQVALREVDRVRVKGKQEAVAIYTPRGAVDLRGKDEEALAAYRAGDLARAEALWRAVLALSPADSVAAVYLERIAQLGGRVPPGWDAIFVLDQK
jgi:adenylate cyclase